jgi:transposase
MVRKRQSRRSQAHTSEQATTENGTVLEVDLGLNNLAVTSMGLFWTGDEFDHWRCEYENRRGSLQQTTTSVRCPTG